MSIQSEITRITNKRDASFTAVANKGVTVPSGSTIDDLPSLIEAIETGGGGGPDFSNIKQALTLNNFGGLLTAFENGTWAYQQKSFTSGTNPISIDFGRAIKGCIVYPKSLTATSGVSGEAIVFGIGFWNDADENGSQSRLWHRTMPKSGSTSTWWPRTSGADTIVNGVYTRTITYPTNANYHPFRFNIPYLFVYWW